MSKGAPTSADAGREDNGATRRRPRVMMGVARSLAREILSGELEPGATLPSENTLRARFGVSRTALRDALKLLGAKGLIETRPRIGSTVLGPEHWPLLDPQVMAWHGPDLFNRRLLDAMLETRLALEPLAASLAARRASLHEVADLEAIWRRMAAASSDLDRFSAADSEFHRLLYAASGSPVLRQIGELIDAALSYSFETSNRAVFRRDAAIRKHGAVVEALRMRDAPAAAAAAVELVEQAAHDIELADRKLLLETSRDLQKQ